MSSSNFRSRNSADPDTYSSIYQLKRQTSNTKAPNNINQHRVALSDVTAQISNKGHLPNSISDNLSLKQSISHSSGQFAPQRREEYFVKELDDDSLFDPETDTISFANADLDAQSQVIKRLSGYTESIADSLAPMVDVGIEEVDADDEDEDDDDADISDEDDMDVETDEKNINDFEEEDDEDDDEDAFIRPLLPEYTEKSKLIFQKAHKECYRDTPDPMDDDTYDVAMVVELADDIFKYLRELENKYSPDPLYMKGQPELKWSFRSTLIDWIVQVHARFQLLPETLYLTVNIIDRFLSRSVVTLNKFQLVGAAALFIAAKFEEINCPALKDIIYMLDNAYSRDDVIKAERFMIDTLEFEIGWPGPMSFLRRISKADDYEYDIRTLAKYLLETTIMDPRLVAAPPSWLAAGAYFLSRIILSQNEWTIKHIYYSGYTQDQIFPLATLILENCRNAQTKHEAIWKKYSERRQHHSAQVASDWIEFAESKMEVTH